MGDRPLHKEPVQQWMSHLTFVDPSLELHAAFVSGLQSFESVQLLM